MSTHSHEEHISVATYTVIFIALMVLLAVTVGVAYIELGRFALIVAMMVATVKAFLICTYFMHMKISSRWTWVFFLSALYVCGVGAVLTFADYLTRPLL